MPALVRLLSLVVATFLFCSPASAREVFLGEIIEAFRDSGYSLIYSTALVNESLPVEWQGDVSLISLREILKDQGLMLTRLEGRRWAIAAALPDEPEAKSADWEPLELPVVDHVVVTASRYELQGDEVRGSHVIGPAELNDNPSFGGDALRIVHRLPGAASIGVTAKPNVRGGSDNELLVMFDGVELIEPFHLRDFQSMFSSFNPQTIESVEFFSGGFPAKYGNKMSGVLDIATQDAFEAPGGELGISAFSLSALYFNETERDQWLLSARRGNLDLVLQSKLGDPRYHDLYGRYSREIKEGRLKASTFVFDDDIVFTDDESSAKSRVKNRYAWFEWERDKKDRASRTILSFGSIDSRRKGFTFAEEDTEGFLVDDQKLEISSLRHLQEYRINDRFRLDFGGTYRHQSMDYDTQIQVTRDVVSEFLGVETDVDTTFREKFDGNSISLFATAKFQTGDRLTTEIGLRWDRQDYAKSDSQLSPRVALLFNINGQWDLRLSYGRFHQPHAIHELKTTDFETGFFKSQKSEHYILATEYRFSNDTRLVAEAFFKKMEDLKPRYVNLFDPYVYLPELQQDRITIYADKAEAKGIELSYTGGGEKFEWNVNYTYSEVQDRDGGRWIDRRWDQTHNLNVFLNWYLGNWTVGAAMAWHTGWATTELPQTLPAAQSLEIPAYRNNSKLKDYGSLDFKVSYDQELSGSSLQYFLEVTNVVSRANKGGVDYEITAGDDVYFLEEFDVQPVFPLVTNLGVIWRF